MTLKQLKKFIADNIAIISLVIAIISCLAAVIVVPEIRYAFGLDPRPTISPEASTTYHDPNNLLTLFPTHIGAKWSYQYAQFTELANTANIPDNLQLGHFTQTIAVVDTGLSDRIKVVGLKVTGENFLNPCIDNDNQPYTGNLETWLVIDQQSLYQVCSRQEAYDIASARISDPNNFEMSSGVLPIIQAPLEIGQLWPAFHDLPPRDDTAYQWLVESQVDITLPAGEYKDCYRIQLNALPDNIVRWVCPDIGIVAEEYHHHGAINDYRYELHQYQFSNP